MYKESWGEKRICPMCSKQYYDLDRSELECPECGKEIEVTTSLDLDVEENLVVPMLHL